MFGAAQHIKNLLFISKEKKRVLFMFTISADINDSRYDCR